MLAAMVHRGSDGDYRWFADGMALGARQLAIVDIATERSL
jgi:asparagine synthetase B (glutamine-hydrolysing)